MVKNGQNVIDVEISNYGQLLDGPSIIAIKGGNTSDSENKISNQETDWHDHSRGKIFCIESGLVHVSTPDGSWVLPSNRAGWIPPNTSHKIRISGLVTGWVIFILPCLCDEMPKSSRVIPMSEVLRALALRATEWDKQQMLTSDQENIAKIICNEISSAPEEALHLPMPKTDRALKVANAIIDNPSITTSLEQWASFGAMSARTLRRIFLSETGLSFSRWRQQAQLARGLDMLAKDISVTEVSDSLGYASPSNFIAMFRKAFGKTPKQYFFSEN
ncbi:AraC family transcriptional regulator [Francisella philomiragia]|uniref:AraC family transcriptional regulator n=1 Tax=Francisella philomiragia TaxID=28110 RepID=UPI001C9DA12E|nr:helix-turn-helix transcriptional regulator [Francisella philomiragia]MBY7733908.1 helix-turn-helix transcriptional regulator [Francisella philomiragia]